MFVKDIHVRDNNLAVYPMETNRQNGHNLGLCHLPELQIGNAALIDWPCLYLERQKPGLFGLSITNDNSKEDSIILGLPALREFKYIVFDSISKEVEFSHDEVFEPAESGQWEQCPLSIEEDFHGNTFLFVTIPIAGDETELQLDTGSGRGLAIAEELWEGEAELADERWREHLGADARDVDDVLLAVGDVERDVLDRADERPVGLRQAAVAGDVVAREPRVDDLREEIVGG